MAEYRPSELGEKRELILKLAQKITDRLGHKVSMEDPEYWGLAGIVTDDMARVALKMKVRHPYRIEQLVQMTGIETKPLESLLYEMAYVGLIEYNWENEDRQKQYILPLFVPGSAEFFNMRQSQIDQHPEVAHFFDQMTRLPLDKVTAMVPPGGAGIGMHVIPVEKAIESNNESIDIEHISHWLNKYEGKYAASPCSCRMSRARMGEGCADDVEDWCIGVGDMADYLVETKRGHYVNKDEVLAILKRAEDNGFVHQITNIDGVNKIFAICNCNVNICNALRTSQLYNTPNMSRSAYVAKVTKENCVACGRCVEHCPAGAVKLGQKLCTKTGEKTYPKAILPDATRWSKDKWTPDYRDLNRINCYDSGTAPCKTACPAHIAVQGYLKLASQGRYQEALELIRLENPFPAVCGRICNRRCEDECTRAQFDQAIAIDEVKKFIAQQELDPATRPHPKKVIPSNRGEFSQKIAIIGAGPAGLSCAYYLALKGYRPTVFERREKPGGMLRYGIPAFKLSKEVLDAEIEIIEDLGVKIVCGIEIGKDKTIEQLRQEGYQAFYLAAGCQKGRQLLAGVAGVSNAVDFLAKGQQKVAGRVVVIGGGNVAIDVARTAKRSGAKEVYLVSLESEDHLTASTEEVEEALADGVTFVSGWSLKQPLLNENQLRGLLLEACVSLTDETGRFNPQTDPTIVKELACEQLIFSIGQLPDVDSLVAQEKLEMKNNKVMADSLTYQSNVPDIFVGGDLYTGPSFAINAISEGHEASESIHRFVHEHASLTIGRNRRQFNMLDKDDIVVEDYDHACRAVPKKRMTIGLFEEGLETLTEQMVRQETKRCLSCGASIVDENQCIGCGVCTTKCAFDAIHLERVLPEASHMVRTEDKFKAILPYAAKRAIKIAFHKK